MFSDVSLRYWNTDKVSIKLVPDVKPYHRKVYSSPEPVRRTKFSENVGREINISSEPKQKQNHPFLEKNKRPENSKLRLEIKENKKEKQTIKDLQQKLENQEFMIKELNIKCNDMKVMLAQKKSEVKQTETIIKTNKNQIKQKDKFINRAQNVSFFMSLFSHYFL